MAIRFKDKGASPTPEKGAGVPGEPAAAPRGAVPDDRARAAGEARFATPIEADAPVNPDAASELPFSELPRAEKKKRPGRRTASRDPSA